MKLQFPTPKGTLTSMQEDINHVQNFDVGSKYPKN